eukprot:COSAG01_NODE_99_length_26583_cov_79.512536_8_plen_55_part_00
MTHIITTKATGTHSDVENDTTDGNDVVPFFCFVRSLFFVNVRQATESNCLKGQK